MTYIIASSWEHQSSTGRITKHNYDNYGRIIQPNTSTSTINSTQINSVSPPLTNYQQTYTHRRKETSLWPITFISIGLVMAGFIYIGNTSKKSIQKNTNQEVFSQTLTEMQDIKTTTLEQKNLTKEATNTKSEKKTKTSSTSIKENKDITKNLSKELNTTDKLKNAIMDIRDL